MSWMDNFDAAALRRETEKAMRLPVGFASPLWLAFGAAASAGVAWWWMSRMSRPFNIEAKMAHESLVVEPVAAPIPIPETLAVESPVLEAAPTESSIAEAMIAPIEAAAEVLEAETELLLANDDLTRLAGVGPKLSAALAERGVTRFAQLAAWTEEDLSAIDAALNLRGRAHRDDWIGQAKAFLAKV
jgi:predicted flap endonuclease-1-like 5' DNA nuclease